MVIHLIVHILLTIKECDSAFRPLSTVFSLNRLEKKNKNTSRNLTLTLENGLTLLPLEKRFLINV